MAQINVPPELSEWISARIAAFPDETDRAKPDAEELIEQVTAFSALPLYFGWTEIVGLKPSGEIISWSTEGEYTGVKPVQDHSLWMCSLVAATERYPELKVFLPMRPLDAIDCPHLKNPLMVQKKILCGTCCGLGWIQPGEI